MTSDGMLLQFALELPCVIELPNRYLIGSFVILLLFLQHGTVWKTFFGNDYCMF